MSALWSGWGADAFTEQVDKATSELLPVGSEDIALNLEICDQVRAKQVPPKQAMQVLKRRVSHKNPNVVLLALGLTDICIKNGGDHFLQEVASREFMDNLVSVLRNPAGVNNDVKAKALGLIQNWSQIAQAKPAQMSYITDIYKQLKSDSKFDFPPLDPNAVASAALVETLTAPEWVDGEVCMRCRTAFTTFNRKHHCRNCGNVFCQQCSSHNMALPWFGIGQDVRVCDGCHTRKGPPKNAAKLSVPKVPARLHRPPPANMFRLAEALHLATNAPLQQAASRSAAPHVRRRTKNSLLPSNSRSKLPVRAVRPLLVHPATHQLQRLAQNELRMVACWRVQMQMKTRTWQLLLPQVFATGLHLSPARQMGSTMQPDQHQQALQPLTETAPKQHASICLCPLRSTWHPKMWTTS